MKKTASLSAAHALRRGMFFLAERRAVRFLESPLS